MALFYTNPASLEQTYEDMIWSRIRFLAFILDAPPRSFSPVFRLVPLDTRPFNQSRLMASRGLKILPRQQHAGSLSFSRCSKSALILAHVRRLHLSFSGLFSVFFLGLIFSDAIFLISRPLPPRYLCKVICEAPWDGRAFCW